MTSAQLKAKHRGLILARLRGRCLTQATLARELGLAPKRIELLCLELQRDQKVMVIENGNLKEIS